MLEIVYGDCWIGDVNEGVNKTVVHDLEFPANEERAAKHEIAQKIGRFYVAPGSSGSFGTLNINNSLSAYVFCFSIGDLAKLTSAMCGRAVDNHPYDACVSIGSANMLAQAIARHGRIDGVPVSEKFAVRCAEVKYEQLDTTLSQAKLAGPDPFRKSASYEAQSEVRIVLYPKQGVRVGDLAVVRIRNPRFILREQQITVSATGSGCGRAAPQSAMTPAEAWGYLIDTFKSLEMSGRFGGASTNDARLAEWELRRPQLALAYWTLRTDFQDDHMDSALLGNWEFDWPVSGYLHQFSKQAGWSRWSDRHS